MVTLTKEGNMRTNMVFFGGEENSTHLMYIEVWMSDSDGEILDDGLLHLGRGEGTHMPVSSGSPLSNRLTVVEAFVWISNFIRKGKKVLGQRNKRISFFSFGQPRKPHVIVEASLDVEESGLVQVLGLPLVFDPDIGGFRVDRDVAGDHFVGNTLNVITQLGEFVRAWKERRTTLARHFFECLISSKNYRAAESLGDI